jgi:hypothetical protein
MASGNSEFQTISTSGTILPIDILQRVSRADRDIGGLRPEDYHLIQGERLNDVISLSWNRMISAWASFQKAKDRLGPSDLGTSITRERWLLVLFQELGYGRLMTTTSIEVDGKTYPVSHLWGRVPIHLLGCNVDLDHRTPGAAGASRMSPHSMIQELLNRSDEYRWGFLSNGLRLRLLRDNTSLVRQSYVEFDLETMMTSEAFSDFVVLWLVCHESRFETDERNECWLDRWSAVAREQGVRALEKLRHGVQRAIVSIGTGLLSFPRNELLRRRLRGGELTKQSFYRQILRIVYRLIFLFAAEDRDLLLTDGPESQSRSMYMEYYSTARLRRLAEKRLGTRHPDLYRAFCVVSGILGSDEGCRALALPALGSLLWDRGTVPDIDGCDIANENFLEAVRALSFVEEQGIRRRVDYRNIGPEELGSVYESLLELEPDLNVDSGSFTIEVVGGNERKTTGSYYTNSGLVECLLDSALDPVLAEAMKADDPEKAILALKICDPACGSGHFLIAAANRIARRLAAVRTGDEEASPNEFRRALRDVIGHCIYGVDINEMAVELCKVNLWLEALEPGKPLSFFANRIKCGNSLFGATPALIKRGIPNDAFEPLEGDDKKTARDYAAQNKNEAVYSKSLLDLDSPSWRWIGEISRTVASIDELEDSSVSSVSAKQRYYARLLESEEFKSARLVADAWCSAFVWVMKPGSRQAVTNAVLQRLQTDPSAVPSSIRDEVHRLAQEYRFFHWHIEFPNVLKPSLNESDANDHLGWDGGFDVVLGNPPWERIKLQEKEFFTSTRPDIANAPNASVRKRMIARLAAEDPLLYDAFVSAVRRSAGETHFLRNSGRYPLCGRGDINTYAVFAELNFAIMSPVGRVGCIVPSGVATDDTTKYFFQAINEQRALVSLYDFENRKKLFPAVDSRVKFCLLTLTGRLRPVSKGAEFAFFAQEVSDLDDKERRFTLTREDISLINPNTHTCPIFRTRRDAEITKRVYERVPVLIRDGVADGNPWGITFMRMFDMSNDSGLFRTREQLESEGWTLEGNQFVRDNERYLPLYEAKMIWQFDHRFGSYQHVADRSSTSLPTPDSASYADPRFVTLPWYWVDSRLVDERLGAYGSGWLVGWRDFTNSTNERTAIAAVFPRSAVADTLLLMLLDFVPERQLAGALVANFNSLVMDYAARQKIGGTHMKYYLTKQLPILPPRTYEQQCAWDTRLRLAEWLKPRFLELIYTADDLSCFANDCDYHGEPFVWDESRRRLIRCELDAAYFHLYGIAREDVEYIVDSFPIVRRHDQAVNGRYITKETVLSVYDEMRYAIESGCSYETILHPGPGDEAMRSNRTQGTSWQHQT